jgi:hypothetical protein
MEVNGQLHAQATLTILPELISVNIAPQFVWMLRSKEKYLVPAGNQTPAVQLHDPTALPLTFKHSALPEIEPWH